VSGFSRTVADMNTAVAAQRRRRVVGL